MAQNVFGHLIPGQAAPSSPAPAPSSAPTVRPIFQAPADPHKQAAERRAQEDQARQNAQYNLDVQRFQYQQDKDRREQATKDRENADKAAKVDAAKATAVQQLTTTIDSIDNAALLTSADQGWWETGKSGAFVRALPEMIQAGTDAKTLEGYLNTAKANTAFSTLQEMRQNSPTGGALGAVSEGEMKLLQSTVGSLDPDQSQEAFLSSLANVKRSYLQMLERVDPQAAAAYNQKKGIRFDANGNAIIVAQDGPIQTEERRDPFGLLSGGGGMPNSPDGTTPPDGDGYWSQVGRGLAQGTGSLVEGIGNIPGIVVNPLMTTAMRTAGYDNYTYDMGTVLREALGLPENQDRFGDAVIQGGTAALTGSLAARGASTLAGSAPVRNALAQFGSTPGRDLAAGAGAGAGGEIGGRIGGVPGQIVGTLAGGAGGYAAASRAAATRTPNALLQSADELGVTMLPADVGGGGTRMASGAVGRTLGGIPLAEGAQQAVTTAGAARNRLASAIGDVTDDAGAGQATRRGFKEFTKSSRERGDELYGKVSVAPDSKVQLANTRGALAEVTRGMESNPELSRLWANHPRLRATLEALTPKDVAPQGRQAFTDASDRLMQAQTRYEQVRSAVSSADDVNAARMAVEQARRDVQAAKEMADTLPQGGELSWQDMNRFRSIVGEVIGQPGIKRDGSDIAALRKLYGALSADMEVTAAQAGPKALQEFRRATQYWRGRESRIDDVFNTLFGNRDQKSDEAVFRQINSWAQSRTGDFSRLARTIRSMPEDEVNTVRATLIQRMGMAKPANQETAQEVFSPAEFSTQWNSLSPRAKSVLFPNKQHRQDLDKFATLMEGMKRATEYQNFSNTSLGVNLTAQGALAFANLPIATALAVGQFSAGKLLASPRFARLVAKSARIPAETALPIYKRELAAIAKAEPVLASDIKALQQHLAEAFGQSPVRAAANEQEANGRREPVQ